jgi:SNF2 family DNA or RNA helicase
MSEVLHIGRTGLNTPQREVLQECLVKKSGGLSVPMGFGKSFLSIVLGLEHKYGGKSGILPNPILVVASKTLIESWKFEINKFFGKELKYIVLHQDAQKNMDTCEVDLNGIDLVLTTPDVVAKYYQKAEIERRFVEREIINEGHFNQHTINRYIRPTRPFGTVRTGGYCLFSVKWSCFIVDEIQKYTNITSMRCQGLGAICAEHRWGMSGTIFDEPKLERILGYYVIIDDKSFPRTLPAAQKYTHSMYFPGFAVSTVYRKENAAFTPPKINEIIITHDMADEEKALYVSMKKTMSKINKELDAFKTVNDVENVRRFGSYLMAILCYLRQCVVCPILPLAKAALDISDFQHKSHLSETLIKETNELGITEWLNDPESVCSSRIKQCINVVEKHADERLVIFTCFRTCLDVVKHYMPKDRRVFTLCSTMSTQKRAKVLHEFKETTNGILLLTYELGAEGLNLQMSHTILMLDFWWNAGKTQQAIARVLRYGQQSEIVNVYYFMSNTGVEKAVFEKQSDKLSILNELKDGPMQTKLKSIQVKDIITFIEKEDNKMMMQNIKGKMSK